MHILTRIETRLARKPFIGGLALLVLLAVYLPTLQTIPNGADHFAMMDVGETQVVLNVWGTLHATGYPLYVITGNVLVSLMRASGIHPATAPALVSLLWGFVALALFYLLAAHLTRRPVLALVVTLLFGLTRSVWLHSAIAEVYTLGLAIHILLLVLALLQEHIPHRVYWLALVGGLGVAHHRAILTLAPALLYAVWPEFRANPRRLPGRIALCLLLGLVGFLPYLYLPLRAQAGVAWVYGEPGTLSGFWDQFSGREAERFIGLATSWNALGTTAGRVNSVLLDDLTAPGLLLGLVGLTLARRVPGRRKAAVTLFISGLTAYAFHLLFYSDVLFALVLVVEVSVAFGWLFALDAALNVLANVQPAFGYALLSIVLFVLGGYFVAQNYPFVKELTEDTTGLETIALAENAPPGSTLMLAWGTRYSAVGFARDVLGQLDHIRLVDHKADFTALLSQGMLVTPAYTFYNQPISWWEERLGTVYLRAVGPSLVQIDTQPERASEPAPSLGEVGVLERELRCAPDAIILHVAWVTASSPERDSSVYVHLLDAEDKVIAQADQFAPVYGLRPLTTWEAGEVVRDVYTLPWRDDAMLVRFGLYRQLEGGGFENVNAFEMPVDCDSGAR